MKNLLIHVSPKKQFEGEAPITIKVQIDNSLALGWKKDDIILATNFDYEYNGIKALVVADENFCSFSPCSTKIATILELFKRGYIGDDIYWYHDIDVYQCEPFGPAEIFPNDKMDIAMTDYGWGRTSIWNGGCIFFKKSAIDIFEEVKRLVYKFKLTDEMALTIATSGYNKVEVPYDYRVGYKSDDKLTEPIPPFVSSNRVNQLNIRYNFLFIWQSYRITKLYDKAIKPIKAVHFHPTYHYDNIGVPNMLHFYMGENDTKQSFLSETLINSFKNYGIL